MKTPATTERFCAGKVFTRRNIAQIGNCAARPSICEPPPDRTTAETSGINGATTQRTKLLKTKK